MNYRKEIVLKDGRSCILRSARGEDAAAVIASYLKTHGETDYLTSYPDECTLTEEKEAMFLRGVEAAPNGLELLAEIDGKVVATAGLSPVGARYKTCHRGEIGISVEKEYWNLGLGRRMLEILLEEGKQMGFQQVELTVVAANERALSLYQKLGFEEFGRNPKGFRSRYTGWQEILLMKKEY